VLVTPAVLWFSLPASAHDILTFVRDFTVRVDGVGDVCSLAVFDFEHHGNARYASPVDAPKARRSNQVRLPELRAYVGNTSRPPKPRSHTCCGAASTPSSHPCASTVSHSACHLTVK
jgi:hypothetical protein